MKIVKFTQTACQPCKVLEMMLNNMGAEVDESLLLDSPELLKDAEDKYGVMSTPTMILFDDNGEEIARSVGVNPQMISGILAQAGKL